MPTFIKTGFWEKLCDPCNGYKGWLNLDKLITSIAGQGIVGPQGPIGPQGPQGIQGVQGVQGEVGAALTVLGSYPDLAAFQAGAGSEPGVPGTAWILQSDGSLYIWNTATNLWEDVGDLQGPQGQQGEQGIQGVQGIQGIEGPQGIQGEKGDQGEMGPQGIQGETGAQGSAGNSVTILGSYADYAAFLAGAGGSPGTTIGDSWILLSDGSLYTWNGTNWFDAGDIRGPQGEPGPQGIQGVPGETGETGAQGIQGIQGEQGIQGIQGEVGPKGDTGAQGPVGIPGLYVQTANGATVTNTTAETTIIGTGIGTLTVPANGFSVGDSFTATLGGVFNANNNQTIRVKVKSGSVILLDSGVQNLGSAVIDDIWSLDIDFTIRQIGTAGVASIVSLGAFHYTKTNNATVQGFGFNVRNNTTFNTTISNTLDITVQWGAASTGNNIYSDIFILNKIF